MPFRNLRLSFLVVILLAGGIRTAATAQVKLESTGPLKDASASAEISKALSAEGHRVVLADGPLGEIWLVTSLPATPDTDREHTNYSAMLGTGALVGVIWFPHGARDFRGQAIKPGAYTLRYAVMPNDGAHMGAAPQRDFLLAVPLGSDSHTAALTMAELLKASSAASGTNHPAVFLLLPPGGGDKAGASAYENPDGYVVFASRAGGVPLALVVKGQAEQ
jgi:hypothetical protein